jgi:hypothetical protein
MNRTFRKEGCLRAPGRWRFLIRVVVDDSRRMRVQKIKLHQRIYPELCQSPEVTLKIECVDLQLIFIFETEVFKCAFWWSALGQPEDTSVGDCSKRIKT